MKVPFTWKITGWFMIGSSAEFPVNEVRPLHYFGEDLVAYRNESGELHVLQAHCPHPGAHLGHGGKVVGDCLGCPFHGWRCGPDGTSRRSPNSKPIRPRTTALTRSSRGAPRTSRCIRRWPPKTGRTVRISDTCTRQQSRPCVWTVIVDQEWHFLTELSREDAKPCLALRKWATQFYEARA